MNDRYEAFCLASPLFYEALHSERTAGTNFAIADRPLPDGWRREEQDDWLVFLPPDLDLPMQGWKIHVSAALDNATRILEAVWDYCVPRGIEFKFLRSEPALWMRSSKYAPRGYSGKLVTIYPVNDAACETILRELGEVLDGERGPYILSDLRWRNGPLYVRYGGFTGRHCVTDGGQIVLAIADDTGKLVPDRRDPVFYVPPWLTLPDFLAPQLAARNAVTVAELPYTFDEVMHFSNGGGLYRGRDTRTGAEVVLKEARPFAGLDALGADAVRRLDREYDMLRRLAGIPGIPTVYERFSVGDHQFLAMEYVDGRPLHRALVRRHPLIDVTAGPAEFAEYTSWATDVHRQVTQTVHGMHERGVVYGDLHLFNVMIRPDDTIALLDFEVASLVEENARPGLGNQGFAAPRGTTGVDVDRYALACLRLAIFLPMTQILWLSRAKVTHLAEVIAEHFPVPPDFLADAVDVIAAAGYPDDPITVAETHLTGPGGDLRAADLPPADLPGAKLPAAKLPAVSNAHPAPKPVLRIEPDPAQWPALRERLARAIRAAASPHREDRLFPGDIEQFRLGGLGLAYGAAGVLYTLSVTGAGEDSDLTGWLLDRVSVPLHAPMLGLYDGIHGVAFVLDHLGHRDEARRLLDLCLAERWEDLGLDLMGGISGIGLNLAHFADRTGDPELRGYALRAADLVAERLGDVESVPEVSGRENPTAGLMHGSSGPALLLMRAHDETGDIAYLDRAAVALRQDLRRCIIRDSGTLEVNEGWRTMPYLAAGSVGVGLALHEYLLRREDEQFRDAIGHIDLTARARMFAQSGLFTGRAGILLYLAAREPARHAEPAVAAQVRSLAWHALPFAGGVAFPGDQLLRLSMDVATGTAGVLLALGAALHHAPVHLPLLAPTGAPRPQTPAPTGRGLVSVNR